MTDILLVVLGLVGVGSLAAVLSLVRLTRSVPRYEAPPPPPAGREEAERDEALRRAGREMQGLSSPGAGATAEERQRASDALAAELRRRGSR